MTANTTYNYEFITRVNGNKEWRVHGKLHREGGLPAIERASGTKEWWVNGKLHRADELPAIELADGTKEWWVNGQRHREGGLPAIERWNGDKEWRVHGKRHRDGGLPAVEYASGAKMWYVNGEFHNTGRPVWASGSYSLLTNVNGIYYANTYIKSIRRIEKWYKRMKQRKFILLVWRTMTPIYFHPNEIGGKKAIKELEEYDMEKAYKKSVIFPPNFIME